jgi:hypothetical protein
MSDATLVARMDELREISRSAFGQRYRLELMLEIANAEDGVFTLTELSKSLDVTMSSLQKPMHDMVAIGLLTPLPDAGSRFRYYTSNPSSAWEWAYELAGLNHADSEHREWRRRESA